MIRFYACSVGKPEDDYDEENLQRIIENKAFILYRDTTQKGVYDEIQKGDILILKYQKKFIGYGETTGIITNNVLNNGWDLWAPVIEWYFFNTENVEQGVSSYGIGWDTIRGGQYGTVKELNQSFGIKKLFEINSKTNLYKELYIMLKDEIKKKEIDKKIELLKYKNQIILQGPPGTGKTRLAKEIASILSKPKEINDKQIIKLITIGSQIKTPTEYNSFEVLSIENDIIKIKPNGAQHDYNISFTEIMQSYKEKHWESLVSENNKNGTASYKIGIAKHIFYNIKIDNSIIIQFHPAYSYEDFVRGIVAETNSDNKLEYKVINKTLIEFAQKALANPSLNYVLIIDEINRANLPSVLGELIYALEYRYEEGKNDGIVESIYALKSDDSEMGGNRELKLPKNLYIIGTMNTADRSVGHIDYAIRRRFAFVDIPTDKSVIDDVVKEPTLNAKAKALFDKVAELFFEKDSKIEGNGKIYLQSDFKAKDVQLGHSYFLATSEDNLKIRLEYEIKPLLREYVKDGILSEKSLEIIETL